MASPKITPFKIGVPEAAIQRLKEKLAAASFTDETLFTDSWDYGAPLSDVKRLAERWRDGFDWRAQEAKLNEVPQFTTKVDVDGFGELNIHFVYKKSSRNGAIPLLFCHGCESRCPFVWYMDERAATDNVNDGCVQGRGASTRSSRSCRF